LHHEFHPLACGEFGVDELERLIAQRAQAFPIFAKRLKYLGVPAGFGADEKKATRVVDAPQIVEIHRAA
jgi:hypothetical protein